jgi:hypothetical protein
VEIAALRERLRESEKQLSGLRLKMVSASPAATARSRRWSTG